jgi:hypothetical protein
MLVVASVVLLCLKAGDLYVSLKVCVNYHHLISLSGVLSVFISSLPFLWGFCEGSVFRVWAIIPAGAQAQHPRVLLVPQGGYYYPVPVPGRTD